MWANRCFMVAVAVVTGLGLSACSGAADGSANPIRSDGAGTSAGQAPGSSQSLGEDPAASGLPKNGAPAVENPLDASMLKDDECAAMTDEQAKQFPGKLDEIRMRKSDCEWVFKEGVFSTGGIGGPLDLDHPGGLSDYYGNADSGSYNLELIDPIKGYPAVNFDIGKEDSGSCAIKVGIRDDLVYTSLPILNSDHPSYDEPCEVAREFAEIVVGNLREAQ